MAKPHAHYLLLTEPQYLCACSLVSMDGKMLNHFNGREILVVGMEKRNAEKCGVMTYDEYMTSLK